MDEQLEADQALVSSLDELETGRITFSLLGQYQLTWNGGILAELTRSLSDLGVIGCKIA